MNLQISLSALLSLLSALSMQAGDNLLVNPGAASGATTGWNIIASGGDGWNTNGQAVDDDGSAFITSYEWCSRSQTIDLIEEGFSVAFLDRSPPIKAQEWFKGISNVADLYYLKIELRAADGSVLDSWEAGNQTTPMVADGNWQEQVHLFENYPAGVRSIYWEDGGKDAEFWAGHYGTLLDGARLEFADPTPTAIHLTPGTYPLNAPAGGVAGLLSADDNEGSTHTFELVAEITPSLLVTRGSDWAYLDDGSDPGSVWTAPAFDDSTWPLGAAELGYGEGDEATIISGAGAHYTNYHRHHFDLPASDLARIESLELLLKRDDGAVVYLNGTEVIRDNLPGGTITSTTPASAAASDDGATFTSFSVPLNLLRAGKNTLAVEIHQVNLTSSDASFDLELIASFQGNAYNNGLFTIDDDLLKFAQPANTLPVTIGAHWTVNVLVTDDVGNTLISQLDITGIADPTQPPTAITLSEFSVNEGQSIGTTVGNILVTDADSGDYHTLALVPGNGDTDNALFQIKANRLVTGIVLDDASPLKSIRLRATDRGGFSFEQDFTIEVLPFNNPPSRITFTGTNIDRTATTGTLVGILETNDADVTDSHVYTFVPTVGSEPVIGFKQSWRYLDNGSDLGGSNWTAPAGEFDDSSWKTGTGSFGYGDAQNTLVDYGPDAANKHITTYFRRSFTLANPATHPGYLLKILRDDGVAAYLNGVEVGRSGLADNATATTFADAAIGDADELIPVELPIPANLLVAGTNTLAVEIHQSSATSSDLTFDLSLEGEIDASGSKYFEISNGNEIRIKQTFVDANFPNGTLFNLVIRSTDSGGASVERTFPLRVGFIDPDDLDDDGLPDFWEDFHFLGTVGQGGDDDSDGDGRTNLEEYLFDTFPTDPNSFFALQIEKIGSTQSRLSWPSSSARRYRVEGSLTGEPGSWSATPVGSQTGTDATMSEIITHSTAPKSLLRVVVEIP
ncbi:hypothetical protein V2O64_08735 [Verrucomicrobiaceae bacterium 227]